MNCSDMGGPGHKTGDVESRVGPGFKRAIRDVFSPDDAGDERLDGLIEQLRQLDWPRSEPPHPRP